MIARLRQALTLVAVALALAPGAARGEEPRRVGSFELRLGPYRPDLDAEFGGRAAPFAAAFGADPGLLVGVHAGLEVWRVAGALELGAGVGYLGLDGHGLLADGSASADVTSLRVVPLELTLTYRYEGLWDRWRLPLAPYLRAALLRAAWWVLQGDGATAQAPGRTAQGATNGWAVTGGVALLLDALDPAAARALDATWGIHHVHAFLDLTHAAVDDFGSAGSWDLSAAGLTWSAGVLLTF